MAFDREGARAAGYSDAEIDAYLAQQPPERSTGERAMRGAQMVGQGFNESLAQTLGALPDAASWALRQVGIPTSAPGQYTDWARRGIRSLTGEPAAPETTGERALQGAGRGIGDAASVMLPAGILARAAPAGSMAQGIGQTLAAQPVLQAASGAAGGAATEATGSPELGLAAALAVPAAMGIGRAVVSPGAIPATRQQAVQLAEQNNIPLTPGQRSGSMPLRTMETVFRNFPTTAGAQNAIEDATRVGFNRATLGQAGINANRATPEVLTRAADDFAQRYRDFGQRVPTIAMDNTLLGDLQDAASRYMRRLDVNQQPIFQGYIDDILNQGNAMPWATYQDARSMLRTQAESAGRRMDTTTQNALRAIRTALDNAAARSMPNAQMADDWTALNREYGNFATIRRAMNGAGERVAEGNVSTRLLRSAVNARDPDAYAMGRGDLAPFARLGAMIPETPQSGTNPQAVISRMLGAGGAGGAAGAYAGFDPVTSAAVTLGGPWMAQRIYNSPMMQAYLRNQVAAGIPPVQSGAMYGILAANPEVRGLLGAAVP